LQSNEFFHSQETPKALLAGDLSQTSLWKLTALPSLTKCFKGASRQEQVAVMKVQLLPLGQRQTSTLSISKSRCIFLSSTYKQNT